MRRWLVTTIVAVLGQPVLAQTPTPAFRDDFSSMQVGAGWQILNESAANHDLAARSGFLRILTQRGALEEDKRINNLFVRQFSGDFVLQTRLEFDPRAGQQFAGLLLYESQTNAAALGLTFVSGDRGQFRGLALVSAALAGSGVQPPVQRYDDSTAANPNVVHLRLLRSGEQLVAGYSEDGGTFTDFGSVLNAFPNTVLVGIGATNGDFDECGIVCDTPIAADFDYFQITAIDEGPGNGEPQVDELTIDGPDQVTGGTIGSFRATAHFDDDTDLDVTAEALWTLAPAGNGPRSQPGAQLALRDRRRHIPVHLSRRSAGGDGRAIGRDCSSRVQLAAHLRHGAVTHPPDVHFAHRRHPAPAQGQRPGRCPTILTG
jgi:hypothetical protein